MWREIGRACGRKQLTAPAVKNIFGDERTTEAVLTFLRDTEVGCMVAIAPLGEEGEVAEGEEDVVFAFVCGRVSIVFPLFLPLFNSTSGPRGKGKGKPNYDGRVL